jgi:outer membrane protein
MNYSLSTSVTLFGGFQTLNSIKQSKYDLLASQQDVQKMMNDISLNIASAYLQILFAQELLATTQTQMEITKLQVERTQKLVEVGNLPKGNLFDIQAQMASEELNVVNAENNLSLSSLNLAQMLNLDTVKSFQIVKPDIAPPSESMLNTTSEQVYETALTRQPEIKSAEFKLRSSEKGISIARAGMYPRLSLSASYGSGYSGASKQLVGFPTITGFAPNGTFTSAGDTVYEPIYNSTYETTPLNTQLDNNLNRSIGFYLTVPLFNNLQTYTAVTRAKINHENSVLALQLQKNNLRQKIQQAYNDANSSLKKYLASKKAVEAMEESFKYTEQKFNVGAITTTDYSNEKNKLAKAKSDMLQSKYDYVFKLKVLDFYQGKPISL